MLQAIAKQTTVPSTRIGKTCIFNVLILNTHLTRASHPANLIEDIYHNKATADVMMGKNNNQAQNSRSNLNTTKHFHIRRTDRGDSETTFDDHKTSHRKTFRQMGQTPRKTLFRAKHRTEVQKEEIEDDIIQLQVRRQLSEVVLRFCLNCNIFFSCTCKWHHAYIVNS